MSDWSYPLRHISIRVPWHDSGWDGTVCKNPERNTSCLKLINIANLKDESEEQALAGQSLVDMDANQLPPCVMERATFMAPFPLERFHEHPYVKTSPETHQHFRPTRLAYPAYAAAGLPFRWLMKPVVFGDEKQGGRGLINRFPLDVDLSYEPKLNFSTHWVQDHRNHRELLDCFWNHVQPNESLVFFYAKQVPLVEDSGRRVLIGAGRVQHLGPLIEYDYDGSTTGNIRSLMWERMVTHSIRAGFTDGFLMPYHKALEKSDDGRAFNPAEVVAFAPENSFTEFSYATEHVSDDIAIASLLACREALLRAGELFDVSTTHQETWIDKQLGRLWKKRGPYPGMGAVLGAMGVPMANFVTQKMTDKSGEDGNPWDAWQEAVFDPSKHFPESLLEHIDSTVIRSWQRLQNTTRQQFLELLCRIDLNDTQAEILAIPEIRKQNGIDAADEDYIQNPYLVYESTRLTNNPVDIGTVDRGIFPIGSLRRRFPLSETIGMKTAVDGRRLCALTIRELETVAERGDTLMPQSAVITNLSEGERGRDESETHVTADLLSVAEDENFVGKIRLVEMSDGNRAYQLERFAETRELIKSTVVKRVNSLPHRIDADWRKTLDEQLKRLPDDPVEREEEIRARKEKVEALKELATRRFSVLIGPAGTGKTTLLSVLCTHPEIYEDGVLMLAPTGKARVRMEGMARQAGIQNLQAYTLAQFLVRSKPVRYDGVTGRYRMTGQSGERVARTVIVDECSMLTEEMTAALLEALSGVHRLIFVGDHRQLPPIGAGRPFTDIIAFLRPDDIEARFPRIAVGYAELTVPRRQDVGEHDDLQLATWFGGGALNPSDDTAFEILSGQRNSKNLQYLQWETADKLEKLLSKSLAETLEFDSERSEFQSFALSLGANLDSNGSAWFNRMRNESDSSAGSRAEHWQILSPVRQWPWGVDSINRMVHLSYRGRDIQKAKNSGKYRNIAAPMGDHQIIYGDKVMNNRNRSIWKKRIFPEPTSAGYLANGEIGIVVGHRRTKYRNFNPNTLEIEFSTQIGQVFKFWKSDFDDDSEAGLELAYALTVHKAQGSEFDVVFFILPNTQLFLTRELIYTALTRQKRKVVILHQGSPAELQQLTNERYSATATRITNLFYPPKLVTVSDKFFEERLIHRTSRGELVRSKSEVIIANLLHAKKIDYHYEHPLEIDGIVKFPDFTIEDDDTGITYYWEHCGMLSHPEYRRNWEQKKAWYMQQGIQPIEEDGGTRGTLIVTYDQKDGGIDSLKIEAEIEKISSPWQSER
ncbi:MAG: ATP-dependent RecD-like DNA helicase [Acidiferrobacterales bacterium]|nr:ATP-dependent RecD-like DNA helicase [Acidiferrobacterales bacterium]